MVAQGRGRRWVEVGEVLGVGEEMRSCCFEGRVSLLQDENIPETGYTTKCNVLTCVNGPDTPELYT